MIDLAHGLDLVPSDDAEALQATVLAAAVNGDTSVQERLASLQAAFHEPYRTVAAVINMKLRAGEYLDRHTLHMALAGVPLIRHKVNGSSEPVTAEQVISLIFAGEPRPGQAGAYLDVLQQQLQANRRQEFKDRAISLATSYGDDPARLLAEVQRITAEAHSGNPGVLERFPSLLMELPRYAQQLNTLQTGAEYLGLNSGFQHLNRVCNGLDTGLMVLAAPPGLGKTSLLWQIACQAAQLNQVPVLFFSLEQGMKELLAKALARFSKLTYHHILRGRLRSDDPQHMAKIFAALDQVAVCSRHLTVIEGDDQTTVDTIQELAAAKMAEANVDRCLIVLDYLQILPPRKDDVGRFTSMKDRVDLHVSALRRIARKLNSPVIAISSENRAGYKSAGLNVFKESGGIEYSADVAMVLTRDKSGDANQRADYRNLNLNVVKNRNGATGVVKFRFYPERMEFVETGLEALPEEDEK